MFCHESVIWRGCNPSSPHNSQDRAQALQSLIGQHPPHPGISWGLNVYAISVCEGLTLAVSKMKGQGCTGFPSAFTDSALYPQAWLYLVL